MNFQQNLYPIIDSHIHLYAETHLPDLSWAPSLPDGHILKRQNSVEQYCAATAQTRVSGFIFVETDRKSSLSEDDWSHAIEEIKFLRRIKSGSPVPGEGHGAQHKSLLLGAVVWAPIGAPVPVLQKYLQTCGVIQDLESKNGLIKGFRRLLQDKPSGTALTSDFVDGLLYIEELGVKTFDLGVDDRQGGHWQLLETVTMLERFYTRSTGKLKFVINHFCKPNLRNDRTDKDFKAWKAAMQRLSSFPTTYMKFSGLFSELEPQSEDEPTPIESLVEITRPYVDVIFENFGAKSKIDSCRVMFGSDWPVCSVGGPGAGSWQHWRKLVEAMLNDQNLDSIDIRRIWADCANEVYDLNANLSA